MWRKSLGSIYFLRKWWACGFNLEVNLKILHFFMGSRIEVQNEAGEILILSFC